MCDNDYPARIDQDGLQRVKRQFFYINGDLHKVLHINRSKDVAMTYCFPKEKRISYVWSEFQRKCQDAFTTGEVANLLGRNKDSIRRYVYDDVIPEPQWSHSLDGKKDKMYRFFSEDDVMRLRDILAEWHRGRPRSDGLKTRNDVPTRSELRFMMNTKKVLYTKEDGEFKPVWAV